MSNTKIKCDEHNTIEISLAGDVKLIIDNTKVKITEPIRSNQNIK